MRKNNKGITLIALVITIIVLLILAGVTIATLTGENGILTQANKAKTSNEEGEAKEMFALISNEWMIEKNTGNKNLDEFLKSKVDSNKIDSYSNNGDGTYTIKLNSYETTINGDTEKTDLSDSQEWDKTATPYECFIWGSDIEGEDGYNTIIGYTSNIQSYTKVRIPSRCRCIEGVGTHQPEDSNAGRSFFTGVKKVEIPDTVEEIGMYAFWSGRFGLEYSLEEVVIPNSVTTIGWRAFDNCQKISSITIPSSVTTIESSAFNNWTSSQTINIQGYSSLPAGWNSAWNDGSAQINWNQ